MNKKSSCRFWIRPGKSKVWWIFPPYIIPELLKTLQRTPSVYKLQTNPFMCKYTKWKANYYWPSLLTKRKKNEESLKLFWIWQNYHVYFFQSLKKLLKLFKKRSLSKSIKESQCSLSLINGVDLFNTFVQWMGHM